jgi:hypothetical protein
MAVDRYDGLALETVAQPSAPAPVGLITEQSRHQRAATHSRTAMTRKRAHMGSVVCAPASLRWEVGNAVTAGVKRRRLTTERARQLVTDFDQVTIRELAIDLLRAVDLAIASVPTSSPALTVTGVPPGHLLRRCTRRMPSAPARRQTKPRSPCDRPGSGELGGRPPTRSYNLPHDIDRTAKPGRVHFLFERHVIVGPLARLGW